MDSLKQTLWSETNYWSKGNTRIFIAGCKGEFWFRVFGYGLLFKNFRKSPPLFSERNYVGKRVCILGHICIKILKR